MYKKIPNKRLTDIKFKQLIDEWIFMTPARICAKKININRNTVNLWYKKIREAIIKLPEPEKFSGIVEVDESYFGQKRPGMTGTGPTDKVAVFGIRERDSGRVWCTVTEGISHEYLIPLIQWRVEKNSTIYTDGFGAYYHLNKFGYTHKIVLHSHKEYVRGIIHTNGIESFWSFAKKFINSKNGLPRKEYQKYIKEAEFRFNNRDISRMRLLVRKLLR